MKCAPVSDTCLTGNVNRARTGRVFLNFNAEVCSLV